MEGVDGWDRGEWGRGMETTALEQQVKKEKKKENQTGEAME